MKFLFRLEKNKMAFVIMVFPVLLPLLFFLLLQTATKIFDVFVLDVANVIFSFTLLALIAIFYIVPFILFIFAFKKLSKTKIAISISLFIVSGIVSFYLFAGLGLVSTLSQSERTLVHVPGQRGTFIISKQGLIPEGWGFRLYKLEHGILQTEIAATSWRWNVGDSSLIKLFAPGKKRIHDKDSTPLYIYDLDTHQIYVPEY